MSETVVTEPLVEESRRKETGGVGLDWDEGWLRDLDGLAEVQTLAGYETFCPVLRFDDSHEQLKTPGKPFRVHYVDLPEPHIKDLTYTPKFVMVNSDDNEEYDKMARQLRDFYSNIKKDVIIPSEKMQPGMYGVAWDYLEDGSCEFRRVKLYKRRFKVLTCEVYKVQVEDIDEGKSFSVPCRRVLFLDKRFTILPRRILAVQLDNVELYKHMETYEHAVRSLLRASTGPTMEMEVVEYNSPESLKDTTVKVFTKTSSFPFGVNGLIIHCLGQVSQKRFREMMTKNIGNNYFSAYVTFLDESNGDLYMQRDSPFYRHFQVLYEKHQKDISAKSGECKKVVSGVPYFAPYKDELFYRGIASGVNEDGLTSVKFIDEGDTVEVDYKKLVIASEVHPVFSLIPELRLIVKLYRIKKNVDVAKIVMKLLEDAKVLKVFAKIEDVESVIITEPGESKMYEVPYVSLWGYHKFKGDNKPVLTNLNEAALNIAAGSEPQKSDMTLRVPEGDTLSNSLSKLNLVEGSNIPPENAEFSF